MSYNQHTINRLDLYLGFYLCFICLTEAHILPEPLMPFDRHNSVCYGNSATHGQYRPSCPSNGSVIAINKLKVAAKPESSGCPAIVTKVNDQIVDSLDLTKVLNETACCLPDENVDCSLEFNYTDSGLDYFYHKSSSGYSVSNAEMGVIWARTNCQNNTVSYPQATHFMYLEYYCINREKIGDLCSNNTYMVTDSAFYLYNTNYPSNMSSTIRSCQCQISTTGTNIQFYSVDMRLHKYNNECKQTFNISDSDGVTSWDCDSAPIFNVTSVPKNQAMTLTFTNYLPVNGGNIWIGFSGDSNDTLKIECGYQSKDTTTLSTTPNQHTHSTKETTKTASTESETSMQASTSLQTSTEGKLNWNSTTVVMETITTTKSTTDITTNDVERPSSSLQTTASTAFGTNTLNSGQPSSTTTSSTDNKYSSSSTTTQSSSETSSITSTESTSRSVASETTSLTLSTDQPAFRNQPTTLQMQTHADQHTVIVKDSNLTRLIVYVLLGILILFVMIIVTYLLCKRSKQSNRVVPTESNSEDTPVQMPDVPKFDIENQIIYNRREAPSLSGSIVIENENNQHVVPTGSMQSDKSYESVRFDTRNSVPNPVTPLEQSNNGHTHTFNSMPTEDVFEKTQMTNPMSDQTTSNQINRKDNKRRSKKKKKKKKKTFKRKITEISKERYKSPNKI